MRLLKEIMSLSPVFAGESVDAEVYRDDFIRHVSVEVRRFL